MIKKRLILVLMAIIVGFIIGKLFFRTYKDSIYSDMNSRKLYLVEKGEYASIDDMRNDNTSDNYIYYKDHDKYRIVVGVTSKMANLDKIKGLYDDVLVEEYYIANDLINNKQIEYDNELLIVNNNEKVKEIVLNILELYGKGDDMRLVMVN